MLWFWTSGLMKRFLPHRIAAPSSLSVWLTASASSLFPCKRALLDYTTVLFLMFSETAILFSVVVASFYGEYFRFSFQGRRKFEAEATFNCRETKGITFVFLHLCLSTEEVCTCCTGLIHGICFLLPECEFEQLARWCFWSAEYLGKRFAWIGCFAFCASALQKHGLSRFSFPGLEKQWQLELWAQSCPLAFPLAVEIRLSCWQVSFILILSSLSFFYKFIGVTVRWTDTHTHRRISQPPIHSLNSHNGQSWNGARSGTQNSIQGSHVGVKTQLFDISPAAFQNLN